MHTKFSGTRSNTNRLIMSDPLVQSYRTYVSRIRKFLFLGGVLQEAACRSIFTRYSAILAASSCFSMSSVVFNFCLAHANNLNVMTKGMSLVCSLIATGLKAVCFLAKRRKLIDLHQSLQVLFDEELAENPKTTSTLLSLLHTFDRPAYTYAFFLGATITLYLVPPLISIIYQFVRNVEGRKYRLPFPAKFPWIVPSSGLLFHAHFFYQSLGAWFLLFTNSGVDGVFSLYTFQIASLLRGMAHRLKNPTLDENRLQLLRDCVKKHRELLRCRDLLQDIYGPIIVWLVMTNGVIMCALVFQAFQSKDMTFGKFFLFAFYMFLKIMHTFMYAWYGGVVTTESEMFRQGLYFCDWPGKESRRLKNELLITMVQRPMTITALRIFFVSVDMFSKIMNTTISYFFLLQTLDEKA